MGSYHNTVGTYSVRELTFQNDILNAYEGIASYLDQGFRGGFTFGLPNTYLEMGLLWISYGTAGLRPVTRREGFPDYSWVSCMGKVSMKGRPISSWPSSRVLWKNFAAGQPKNWVCEADVMPRPGSEEAMKWSFAPEGSALMDRFGKQLSVSQPFWEDSDEQPRW